MANNIRGMENKEVSVVELETREDVFGTYETGMGLTLVCRTKLVNCHLDLELGLGNERLYAGGAP